MYTHSQNRGFEHKVFLDPVPVHKPPQEAALISELWDKMINLSVHYEVPTIGGDTTLFDDAICSLRDKDEDALPTATEVESLGSLFMEDESKEWQESELDHFIRTQGWNASQAEAANGRDTCRFDPFKRSPSPTHFHSPATASRLKANATPFVPTSARPSALPTPELGPSQVLYVAAPTPAWFPSFMAGVTSISPQVHREEAFLLVDNHKWNNEEIGRLAQQFFVKGAEGLRSDPHAVAKFAGQVRNRFRSSEWKERAFTQHLQEVIANTFAFWWTSSSSGGIVVGRCISPELLSSAFCLAIFVGNLFVENLLRFDVMDRCIRILLLNMHSIEHLYALHLLCRHSTFSLWAGRARKAKRIKFLKDLSIKAKLIADNSSVADVKFGGAEVRSMIENIAELVNPRH